MNPKHYYRRSIIFMIFLIIPFFSNKIHAKDLPKVRVVSVKQIFDNGEHNAFTDMIRYKGKFYLTFRSCPDGHMVHPTSSIIVMQSEDTKIWQQVFQFSVKKRDTRDPHFLIFKDKLFVYSGTWYCGDSSPARDEYDINQHLGYGVWTNDGVQWQQPQILEGTFGFYIWRAATYENKAYLCARRKKDFVIIPKRSGEIMESLMLESEDGLVWSSKAMFQEKNGDETAFVFESDGSVLAVSRRGRGNAEICRSKPPYEQWHRQDLGCYIGGPLLAKWGDRYLVGGRKKLAEEYKTVLYWLKNDELFQFALLPSGGDNSYPGFLQFSPTKALVSYYSSHEKDADGKTITAIYLAELEIVE